MNMTSRAINIYNFKAEFSKYAKEVLRGASLVISIRNKPFAEFRPISSTKVSPFKYGVLNDSFKGFELPDDFNDSLSDFESDFYSTK